MPFRHCEIGSAEGFSKVGPVDKAQGNDTGHHRIDINLRHTDGIRNAVESDLQTVENQQHQHQVRHTTDQGGIAFKQQNQCPIGRKLRARAHQAY
ncbi:Uncharacterised protein [Leclercia adecarboxylata]|uniref:Uncharacterized protein n=1 Tax=Leclercia adecarboxylata TaxID=83655 RepID=A0A4U9I6L9_9ENTR|nr:Uncharacterised protein [Leclercia adecarboxylata]